MVGYYVPTNKHLPGFAKSALPARADFRLWFCHPVFVFAGNWMPKRRLGTGRNLFSWNHHASTLLEYFTINIRSLKAPRNPADTNILADPQHKAGPYFMRPRF